MKNTILFLLLICTTFYSRAQEKVLEYDPGIKNMVYGIATSYHAANSADSSVAFFILESNNVHGVFCDKQFNILAEMVFEQKEKEYFAINGHSIEGNTIHLFFSGKKANELYAVSFDPVKKRTYGTWVPVVKDLNENDEVYVSAINHKNTLFQLYINKNTSALRLYKVSSPSDVTSQTFGLSSDKIYEQFFKSDSPLSRLSIKNLGSKKVRTRATTINAEEFYTLEITSERNKIFSYQDHIIMTMDEDMLRTTLIDIDTDKNTAVVKNFNHLDGSLFNTWSPKTASFCYRNNLLQLRTNKNHLTLSVRNIEHDTLVALFEILAKDPSMSIINSPVVETNNGFSKVKKFKPKTFLRKLDQLTPSVSAFRFGNNLEITLGGYLYSSGYSAPFITSGMSVTGGIGGGIPVDKIISATGLFDLETFKHISGTVKPHFQIKASRPDPYMATSVSGEIKFSMGGYTFCGYYDTPKHKYFVYRYND